MEPEALAAQVLELGCDAVSVAVVYHRGRRVFPRHRRVSVLTRTTMYVEPERARYGTLVPEGTRTEPLLRFREACERSGLRFRAWVVGLHNGELAAAHPDAAARLLDGSPAGHSLCPSAPEAVEYVAALVGDVAAQLEPEYVDLEAAFYPAWEPSYTLTLALEPLSEQARLLGPQCFCVVVPSAARPGRRGAGARAAGPPFADAVAGVRTSRELAAGRAAGAARLVEAAAATVHAAGSSSPRLRLRPAGAGGAAGRLARSRSPPPTRVLFGCGALRGRRAAARASPGCARSPAAPARSRRTGRPTAPSSRPTSSGSRRPAPTASRSTTSRSSRRRDSTRSGRPRTPSAQAWPHDRGRRPRHARPREGRVSDCGGAARDDGPARDRAGARLAGRGLPAGAEPRGERARRARPPPRRAGGCSPTRSRRRGSVPRRSRS